MKGTEKNTTGTQGDKDVLEELFQHASARVRPSTEDERKIRDTLHTEWLQLTRRRRRIKFAISMAAAASVVLAVVLTSNLLRSTAPAAPALRLATVNRVVGSVFLHPEGDGTFSRAEPSRVVQSGQQIVTGRDSALALRWEDGTSLRVDQNSEINFTASGEAELVSGRLYVDTEQADDSSRPPVILTPAGPVRHLGTQYMTGVSKRETRVSVRQGQVALGEEGAQIVASGGEQLSVGSSGVPNRLAISVYGDMWQWTESVAPAFDADGRALSDLLDWVGRESGRSVEFASPAAERLAADTVLRGDIDLEPMRALTLVLQTTDLVSEIEAGTIVIAFRK